MPCIQQLNSSIVSTFGMNILVSPFKALAACSSRTRAMQKRLVVSHVHGIGSLAEGMSTVTPLLLHLAALPFRAGTAFTDSFCNEGDSGEDRQEAASPGFTTCAHQSLHLRPQAYRSVPHRNSVAAAAASSTAHTHTHARTHTLCLGQLSAVPQSGADAAANPQKMHTLAVDVAMATAVAHIASMKPYLSTPWPPLT